MLLKKLPSIEADEFKPAKWDEVTRGRDFRESDALTLEVLMEWYIVVRQCIEDSVPRTRGDDPDTPQVSPGHDAPPEPLVARTRRLPAGPGLRPCSSNPAGLGLHCRGNVTAKEKARRSGPCITCGKSKSRSTSQTCHFGSACSRRPMTKNPYLRRASGESSTLRAQTPRERLREMLRMLQAFARIRFFSPDALLVDDSILVEISNQERIQIGPVILIYDLLADYLPIMQACIIGVD